MSPGESQVIQFVTQLSIKTNPRFILSYWANIWWGEDEDGAARYLDLTCDLDYHHHHPVTRDYDVPPTEDCDYKVTNKGCKNSNSNSVFGFILFLLFYWRGLLSNIKIKYMNVVGLLASSIKVMLHWRLESRFF